MKKILTILVLILTSTVFFIACGSGYASSETIVWEMIDFNAQGHPVQNVLHDYADEVYEKTDGQLEFRVRVAGELPFGTAEHIRACGEGSVQTANALLASVTGDLQAASLLALPFMVTTPEELKVGMDALRSFIDEELDAYNTTLLMYYNFPSQNVFGSGETPKTLKDIKGYKVRTYGAEVSEYFSLLGAIPVSISASEVVSALNKNVVKAVMTAAMTIHRSKWYEPLDWAYMIEVSAAPTFLIVNNDALAKLPKDVKQVLFEVSEKYQKLFPDRIAAAEVVSRKALTEEIGMDMVFASDEEKMEHTQICIPIWEKFAKRTGGNAVEGLDILREALKK